MKILLAFGTRPEAIKMCPLILELKKHTGIESVVCLTGQHKEMIDPVMDFFRVSADYNLEIMKDNQTLSDVTIGVLEKFGVVLEKEKPDLVFVHGDTTTSFAVALSCFYHHIPTGHVEAGLRTYDMTSPFPEEFNRQSVDMLSSTYFAPTNTAKHNLLKEGKHTDLIYVTGNTVIDALRYTVFEDYHSKDLDWAAGKRLILMTAHRRENIGEPMRQMFAAIRKIADENDDVRIIYPIHKNPKVREIAYEYFQESLNIRIIEPLDVVDFHNYLARSFLVITDSGGIQEEAPYFGVPVLVMRNTTERPEGIESGTVRLIGTSEESVYANVKSLLVDTEEYLKMHNSINPYGDGHASERIVEATIGILKKG